MVDVARRIVAVRAAARTAVFFLKVLPMLPSRPVNWVTPSPVVERVAYPAPTGVAEGDVYRPSGRMRVPGIVVCLGVVPFGVDHPQVPRLGEALARAGFAALLYWSPAMRDERLDPIDADGLALAYDWLVDQPYIDPSRSGFLGTCVGGAFALLAAAQPLVRDRVAFVTAFAPYSSMWTLARDIASATRVRGAAREQWQVDQLTRKVFVRSVTATLPPDECRIVRAALEPAAGTQDLSGLSTEAQVVYRLLTAGGLEEADEAIEEFPPALRERLTALSPLSGIEHVRAPLIAFGHDQDDGVVPVSESRQLDRALRGRPGAHYTEFALFEHATPRSLPPIGLVRQLGRFCGYVYPLFRATS